MNTQSCINNLKKPLHLLEIKNEPIYLTESKTNVEHDYCVKEYTMEETQNLITMQDPSDSINFQTLENVEPKLVLVTYVKDDEIADNWTYEDDQDEADDSVQVYRGNEYRDIFICNGNRQLSESVDPASVVNLQSVKMEYDELKLENNSGQDYNLVHKVTGSEIWIMVEPIKTECNENIQENESINADESFLEDNSMYEITQTTILQDKILNETAVQCEGDKCDPIVHKPKSKVNKVERKKSSLTKKGHSNRNHSQPKTKNYDRVTKNAQKRSWVWKYFSKQTDVIYQCSICQFNLSIKGSNTNNMNRHIRTKHFNTYKIEVESKDLGTSDSDKTQDYSIVACDTDKTSADDKKLKWRSWVWLLFEQVTSKVARCKLCNRKITHGGTATGNLNRHIKLLHTDVYVEVFSTIDANKGVQIQENRSAEDEANDLKSIKFND